MSEHYTQLADSEPAMSNQLFVTIFNDPTGGEDRFFVHTDSQIHGGRGSTEPFRPPIELQALPRRYASIDAWLTPASNALIQQGLLDSNSTDHERLRGVGGMLFDALLPKGGPGRVRYETLARSADQAGQPLRVCLKVASELSSVPWNLLWDTLFQRWLANDGSRTLILTPDSYTPRFLDLSTRQGPLRVVIVLAASSAGSSPDADTRYVAAIRSCFDSLRTKRAVVLELIQGPDTYGQLERRLQQATPIHILDIFAHGIIDGDEHIVQLTDAEGGGFRLPSTWLRGALRQRRAAWPKQPLLCAILNNCDSAHALPQAAISSLAAGLADDGVPVVLGLQVPIWDDIVCTLMPILYAAILEAMPIDQALNLARQHIYNNRYTASDWAVPVLFVHPQAQELRFFKTPPKKRSPDTTIRSGGISREEFLLTYGLHEMVGKTSLFARRSELLHVDMNDIFVEGPLHRLTNHDPNSTTPITPGCGLYRLSLQQSLFLIAPPGYGKTGYRICVEQKIGESELVICVDFGVELDAASSIPKGDWLELIKRKIHAALVSNQSVSPEKKTELQSLLQKEFGSPSPPFGVWIEQLVGVVRKVGFPYIHFMFDGLDNLFKSDGLYDLEHNLRETTAVLTHLIERPTLLHIDGFAFKFFLPDDSHCTMQNFIIERLGTQRPEFPIYRLTPWQNDRLIKFMNQRLRHFTDKQRLSSKPPVRLQDLCAADVRPSIEERLCAAAKGSPRSFIELLERIVDTHCAGINNSSDRIPQSVIDTCLRGYV